MYSDSGCIHRKTPVPLSLGRLLRHAARGVGVVAEEPHERRALLIRAAARALDVCSRAVPLHVQAPPAARAAI